MKTHLSLETIHELNGGAAQLIFQRQLAAVMRDCEDRPALFDKREIPMKLVVIPTPDPVDGKTLIGFEIALEISNAKLPSRKLVAERLRCEIMHDANGLITGIAALLETDPYQDRLIEGAN